MAPNQSEQLKEAPNDFVGTLCCGGQITVLQGQVLSQMFTMGAGRGVRSMSGG